MIAGHDILAFRSRERISQAEFAKRVGTSQSTIARIEGGTKPRAALELRLAGILRLRAGKRRK